MSKRFAVVSVFVAVMLLLGAANVGAQAPTPKYAPVMQGDLPTRGGQPLHISQSPIAPSGSNGQISAQAHALGKPGTVFRYTAQYGENGVAYPADGEHINSPSGLVFDQDGNLYVTEEAGARLLKFNASGQPVWQSGVAGFHYWWTGTGYAWPKDVAIAADDTLWVAGNDIATHVDPADGTVLGIFPENSSPDDDDTYFRDLMGVAFDTGGRMYLSDAGRHRVQVFTFDTGGNPIYAATLGETDTPGDDGEHFNSPGQVVVDSNDVVYVADGYNYRVQRCDPTGDTWPWTWACTTYAGDGTQGGDPGQLNQAYGIGLSGSDLLVADSGNGRLMRCTAPQTCSDLVTSSLGWVRDADESPLDDTIYIADAGRHVVWEYTGSDADTIFVGTSDTPYTTDNQHFYWPHGIEVDPKGNLIVLEENGQRMTKMTKTGAVLWSFGVPGVERVDATHLSWPRVATTDSKGNIYVAEGGGISIFDTNGHYVKRFPHIEGSLHFSYGWITGLAVDSAGNLYVSDSSRHRVTVYSKTFAWLRTIGIDDECGPDNAHFCSPMGLALDSARNLYVADWMNHRVQKFDKNGKFLMTFGNGLEGDQTGRLNGPVDVAVDAKGNVYVAEESNSRVSVFDKTGAFLTMIGGWGTGDGYFLDVGGLALDKAGNLYVTDAGNGRIQAFAPGMPYWGQININGFGRRENAQIRAMTVFKNQVYAAPAGWEINRGLVYRQDKTGWTAVVDDGFENPDTAYITALFVYRNYLYAATNNAQVYRSQDGLNWEVVILEEMWGGANTEIFYPGPLTGKVCVSTVNWDTGAELWCSPSGDRGTWQRELVTSDDLDSPEAIEINAMIEYNGATYLTTSNWQSDTWEGAQVWRQDAGDDGWTQVNENGFGDPGASGAHSMAIFMNSLYLITEHRDGGESKVFRCQTCDGSDWTDVTPAGLPYNQRGIPALQVMGKALYAVIGNYDTGLGVWVTTDGLTWKQVGAAGLGDTGNTSPFTNYSVTVLKNALYIGVSNTNTGGEIWKYCPTAKVCK